jgi:hypothetical protein
MDYNAKYSDEIGVLTVQGGRPGRAASLENQADYPNNTTNGPLDPERRK